MLHFRLFTTFFEELNNSEDSGGKGLQKCRDFEEGKGKWMVTPEHKQLNARQIAQKGNIQGHIQFFTFYRFSQHYF